VLQRIVRNFEDGRPLRLRYGLLAGPSLPAGAPERAFLASLIFFSNCNCWSWLNVMPNLSA
jgi:hypothetical protein